MDAQRALVEGGNDDAGTGELVVLNILTFSYAGTGELVVLNILTPDLKTFSSSLLILSLLKAPDAQSISSTDLVVVKLSVHNK